jgi:acetylornithine/N-succinyldiaminopimelate aminotransferase
MSIRTDDATYIANTYARFPIEIVRGEGSIAWDENGKKYIDLGSGIAVNSFGYSDPAWIEAVTEQLHTFQHTSNLYYSAPCVKLAKALCERTGMKKVFFGNSGAEANECAIKAARAYAERQGRKKAKIITLENSFHGRTLTTLAATGQEVFHRDFLPLTEGFVYAKANDIESVRALTEANDIAGIFFECVQGEGGVVPLEKDFVQALADIAKEKDILLMVDEVQTGNGRTGTLYAYMQYGITPDIVSTAKGLGGGLPIGATMLGEKVQDVLGVGMHGSTFGGNPVSCAGALSILNRIDEALLQEVSAKSALIRQELSGAKGIHSVTGLGLMLGLETERDASAVIADCREQGVLVIKAKNKVRLLPALNIPETLLRQAIATIRDVCAKEG